MCNACFANNKIKTTTTFTVEYNGGIIVVRNVPCLECQKCGEITFTDDVAERLEKIVAAAKTVLQDFSVIDYSKVA
ncbi:type II toxin-antitoxin system MqsA family antitoxin [Oribacterium sp. FC2011]|uniref:type II toxin-antitoxin system MqsA family antitoxin n=1 Tax=Oribacterium sp. FC2011 TaxID=1408311 RepID=UPI0004E27053|nr:type II toxin-antitoxin system MqsA family antitoxin [Oribacterium sp. FC2011]